MYLKNIAQSTFYHFLLNKVNNHFLQKFTCMYWGFLLNDLFYNSTEEMPVYLIFLWFFSHIHTSCFVVHVFSCCSPVLRMHISQ